MPNTDTAANLDRTNDLPFTAPIRIGAVTLKVRDLDNLSRYYQHVVGLRILDRGTTWARLGVQGSTLLELIGDPAAEPHNPHGPGLFHTAFLLPNRSHLALWTKHAVDNRFLITGASDHGASQAIYLSDPEGNGIEIYADRPQAEWRHRDGGFEMTTEQLDVSELIREAAGRWNGMPDNSTVGHVHLKVSALESAETFYSEVLGLEVTSRRPGAIFFGSGGYHHHIATNVWSSRGAGPRPENAAGLAAFEIIAEERLISAIGERAEQVGTPILVESTALTLRDPGNISVQVSPLAPK